MEKTYPGGRSRRSEKKKDAKELLDGELPQGTKIGNGELNAEVLGVWIKRKAAQ